LIINGASIAVVPLAREAIEIIADAALDFGLPVDGSSSVTLMPDQNEPNASHTDPSVSSNILGSIQL